MTDKLTYKGASGALRALGIILSRDSAGEYRVRLAGSPAGHGAYDSDLQSAFETGKAMAAEEAQRRTELDLTVNQFIAEIAQLPLNPKVGMWSPRIQQMDRFIRQARELQSRRRDEI